MCGRTFKRGKNHRDRKQICRGDTSSLSLRKTKYCGNDMENDIEG